MASSRSIIITTLAVLGACAHAPSNEGLSRDDAASKLRKALECRNDASPTDLVEWVRQMAGVQAGSTRLDGHGKVQWRSAFFTLPHPVNVFGQSVQILSITPMTNMYGDYLEYSSFVDQRMESVAAFAEMKPDFNNVYHRRIGTRELTIRPENGRHYIVCANDVRSFSKNLNYWANWIYGQINPEGTNVDEKSQNNPYRGITRVEEYEIERKSVQSPSFSFDPPSEK